LTSAAQRLFTPLDDPEVTNPMPPRQLIVVADRRSLPLYLNAAAAA
jgi:hypothetical protein